MAKKSRYLAYMKSIQKREERKSSPASILKRLHELKNQNAVISFAVGQSPGEKT